MTLLRSQSDDQKTDKKRATADFFDVLASPGYGLDSRFFPAMGKRVVEIADIQPGHLVLDVAAGRWALLFAAAKKAGPNGEVIGIDLADSMVHETSAEITAQRMTNCKIVKMDAENLEFPDGLFDRVLCGFALFFFPNLEGALAEFRRVMKLTGRLVVSTFAGGGYPWVWYEDLLNAYGISSRDKELDSFITDSLDEPTYLRAVLERAGFSKVKVAEEEYVDTYPDATNWWDWVWSSSDGALLQEMNKDQIESFKSDAFEYVNASAGTGGFRATYKALIASGEMVYHDAEDVT